MRIERLSLKGFLRFTDVVTLDLRELPPGLIAIVGENGAGKTTLLEAAMACLHRTFPSRDGELVDYAGDRDSYIELEFSTDGRGAFRARVNVDGLRRGGDAVLEQLQPGGGRAVLNDGKVSTFDDVIRREFPSKELMLASCFAAQNKRGNFIGKKPKDRKDLFAELLGLQAYEGMSQTAKTAAGLTDQARSRLVAIRSELARDTAEQILAQLERQATELQFAGAEAELRRRDLKTQIEDLEARLAMVQDQVAAYAVATQRVRTLDNELAARREERRGVTTDREQADRSGTAELRRLAEQRDSELHDIDTRLAGNASIKQQADQIRAAVAAIQSIDGQLEACRAQERTLTTRASDLAGKVRSGERAIAELDQVQRDRDRSAHDAELLTSVPCGGAAPFATCQFLSNAAAAKDRVPSLDVRLAGRAALVEQLQVSQREEADVDAALQKARATIQTIEADRIGHQRLASYAEALAAAEARIAELTEKRQQAEARFTTRDTEIRERTVDQIAALADRATALDRTIDRLSVELETAQADLSATATGNAEAVTLQNALGSLRMGWDETTAAISRVDTGRQELQRRREELVAKRHRRDDVDGRIASLETELLEWQQLTKALGLDGLPVLEIDAAGPTISAYTNDLLAVCFGPRFTVELVTQQAKADGKGMKDDFTIKVTDNQRGAEPRDVADLSGGEQVIVSEALMNAIAVYVNTRSPMPIRTCWRDETTGALDPENAGRYFQMLRKVHELGGYHHIFFVSHNADIAAMADAQIHVAGGCVSLHTPPYVREAA